MDNFSVQRCPFRHNKVMSMNPFYPVRNIRLGRMDSSPIDELLIEQSHDLMGLLPKACR